MSDTDPTQGVEVPTVTAEMIHAAQRVQVRYIVADDQGITPAEVTDGAIDAELAEIREIDEADRAGIPELPSLDDIFAEMLTAAPSAPDAPEPAVPEGLTKLTVYLTPNALAALNDSAEACGDTRTDTVNRALILYGQTAGAYAALTVAVGLPKKAKAGQ